MFRIDSDIGELEVGVLQGSCLGPLLLLKYIKEPPRATQGFSVTMFAHDTNFCHQSHDLTQLNEAINSDLNILEILLRGNKLSLNVAKTHSMLISTSTKQRRNSIKSRNEALELKIRDNEIEVVQQIKYLGVQIDCSLDW